MRRLLPLLLLAAPALCWAATASEASPKPEEACECARPHAAEATDEADPQQQVRGAAATSTRAAPKPVLPTGGNDVEDTTPRVRGPRWHSFLPGMFR